MATYLATVVIADLELEHAGAAGGVPIRNYFPADMPRTARQEFDRTGEMLEYFTSILGAYPFDAYGVVVAPIELPFALETQTLTLFGIADRYNEGTIAHELAHQWFSNSISLRRWQDIWLNEGFATYASLLWFEHRFGAEPVDTEIHAMYRVLMDSNDARTMRIGAPPSDDLFNGAVYWRGAMTLHALRQEVGDPLFFQILRTYVERFRYGNATTDDFIALAEEISVQDLRALFDAWLFQEKVPFMPGWGAEPGF
jgi:aminopeptidase N